MTNLPRMQVLITTNDQYIDGELVLPKNIEFSDSTPDKILFRALNEGTHFVTIKNCEIRDRQNIVFRPDKTPFLHVNISAIISAQILEILSDNNN